MMKGHSRPVTNDGKLLPKAVVQFTGDPPTLQFLEIHQLSGQFLESLFGSLTQRFGTGSPRSLNQKRNNQQALYDDESDDGNNPPTVKFPEGELLPSSLSSSYRAC
jgi:hypothetical protein